MDAQLLRAAAGLTGGSRMKRVLRGLVAVAAGIALALALVVAVEALAEIAHPAAPFNGDVLEQVRRYPPWVLGFLVIAWSGIALTATWVASKIGRRVPGGVVALLLAWALVFNLAMLPYATWFKTAMAVAFPIACALGFRLGNRAKVSNSTQPP